MTVAGIGGVEIRVGQPVFKPESLAGQLEILGSTLQNDVGISVGVGLPAFALVSPSQHARPLLVAASRDKVAELLVGVLRELGQVAYAVESQLVAGLDSAEVEACVMHRLVDEAAFASVLALQQCGEDANRAMHAGVGVAEGRARLGGDIVWSLPPAGGGGGACGHLCHRLVCLEIFVT